MGEWSKSIGEHGEDIVLSFLKFIGWRAAVKGVDVNCIRPVEHQVSSSERSAHGIDYVYTGRSPLEDGVLKHLCISSKFSSQSYPRSPASAFKDHFTNLATAIECFKRSAEKKQLNIGYTGISAEVVSGVLFWINDKDAQDHDVVTELAGSKGLDEFSYGRRQPTGLFSVPGHLKHAEHIRC